MSALSSHWTLCLTSRHGRTIVRVAPTATTTELYQLAEMELAKSSGSKAKAQKVASLKYGFPPKAAPNDNSTTIESILQNQERIQVEFGESRKGASTAATRKARTSNDIKTNKKRAAIVKKSAEHASDDQYRESSPGPRKSRRAAAQRATENMPAVIKAQEELMKQQFEEQQKKGTKRHGKNTSFSLGSSSNRNTKKNAKPQQPNFSASLGEGRRLRDGATVAPPPSSRSRSNRKRAHPESTELQKKSSDMSEALLGALNDSGKMGQVLRKGMKNAVQASYETTRAFSRLAAIQANTYTKEMRANANETGDQSTTSSSSSSLYISYKGSVDKTKTEEKVDCIPRDVLEAVLKGIHASNTEALRPENLALLSPRVLWSLVHAFPDLSSIPDMYKALLPGLDWNFLRRRAQHLSEKAQENLRQRQEEDDIENGVSSIIDGERAADAIAAVEHAMEHLQDYSATERQARQAQAALNRLQASSNSQQQKDEPSDWQLITPTEPDRDELRECIATSSDTDNISRLITRLMREFEIHNWRELANVKDVAGLSNKLQVPNDEVQAWIDVAQGKSVDEIIVEICDQNISAVEALIAKARSGTPKDLAAWRRIPEMLHERLVENNSDLGTTDETHVPSVEKLQTWCYRAHQILQEYEWLNWYATPVE